MAELRPQAVRISVTTLAGEVLDQFVLCHWRTQVDDEDQENVGSHASNANLAERLSRYVAVSNG